MIALRAERGSTVPLFGGLAFVALLMIALTVELALVGTEYRQVAAIADASAEAGAAMVTESSAYGGSIVVDTERAVAEAERLATSLPDTRATVRVAAEQVCVTIVGRHQPATLAFVGVSGVDITVTSCAQPRVG
ncbi:MAG: hypothetical protein R2823_06945 [Acidimicrobiia bacterium]